MFRRRGEVWQSWITDTNTDTDTDTNTVTNTDTNTATNAEAMFIRVYRLTRVKR